MHIPNQNTKWQKWDFQTYRIYKMQTCLANTNPINVSLSLLFPFNSSLERSVRKGDSFGIVIKTCKKYFHM